MLQTIRAEHIKRKKIHIKWQKLIKLLHIIDGKEIYDR